MNCRTSSLAGFAFPVLVGVLGWGLAARAEAPFGPGEESSYVIQYLGVRAGKARVTIGEEMKRAGKSVWPIIAIAKTDSVSSVYPLKDKFISYWDPATQQTTGSDLMAEENQRRRRIQVELDQVRHRAHVVKQKEGEPASETDIEVSAETRDMTGVTFALRTLPLGIGAEYRFPVYTGAKSFELRATVEAVETLETVLGKRDVLRIRVKTEFSGKLKSKRDLIAYYTADALHIPVRIEAYFILGSLVADLTEYLPGRAAGKSPPTNPRLNSTGK